MNLVDMLRECVGRDRQVLATFEHGHIVPGWHSDTQFAPQEQSLVVLGAEVNGRADDWSEVHLQVGEFLHGACTPCLLTLIPPRQSYEVVLPQTRWHPPGPKLEPGVVKLLGWVVTDS